MKLKSEILELRGLENKVSKEGAIYYSLYAENSFGKPYTFYVPDANAFAEGLKKGDAIIVTFDLSYYKGFERLTVVKVEKADT